jgi:hypothetical protein
MKKTTIPHPMGTPMQTPHPPVGQPNSAPKKGVTPPQLVPYLKKPKKA